MTKYLFKFCALLLLIILLAGCSETEEEYSGLNEPLKNAEPDAPVVSDGGLAVKQGQWIYYINGDNFTRHTGERFSEYAGALIRMKEDGSEKAIVLNKDVSLFNVCGNKIYLCIYEENQSKIASVNVDGTEYKKLKIIDNIYYGGFYGFSGEYIYFTEDFMLYRMNNDGSNVVQITQFPVYNVRVSAEYVYFTREDEGEIGNLYKMIDGQTSFVEITASPTYVIDIDKDIAYYYILQNGNVYRYDAKTGRSKAIIFGGFTDYIFEEEAGFYGFSSTIERNNETYDGLYVISTSNGEKKKISENSGKCMAYYNGYIYYINATILNQLNKCSLDGSVDECLFEEIVFDFDTLDIVDNYMYFISDSDDGRIYRMNLDTEYIECIEYDDIAFVG